MALSEDPPRSKLNPVNPDAFAETMSNGMTQAFRDATLAEHNQLRRTIVQASDMIELTYDMQLETVAQNYLNRLGSGSFSHNSRATADYAALGGSGYVGENWYSSSPTDAASKWCTFVWPTSWGGNGCSEEQNYFATNPNGFAGANIPEYSGRAYGSSPGSQCRGGTTGHYTQVLWAKSARVGCGYTSSGGTLCNYAPGGNFNNQDFFTPGAACSACPSGYTTCNNGLCSNGAGGGSSSGGNSNPNPAPVAAPTPAPAPTGGSSSSGGSSSGSCTADLSVAQCQPCSVKEQCEQSVSGGYCCPYMKVCVATGSTSCGGTLGLCNNPRCGEWTTGFPDSCTSCQNYEWKNVVSCAAGQTSSPVPAPTPAPAPTGGSSGGSCNEPGFCPGWSSYCGRGFTSSGGQSVDTLCCSTCSGGAAATPAPAPAPSGGGSCSDESFCSGYTSSFPQYCPYTMTYNGVAKPFSEYCPSSCNACP